VSATALARELVTQLAAAGVRDVVLSPGSRSAPLAYAFAAADSAGWLRTHVRLDERGAGFFAVGLARAGLLRGEAGPVAVVTTSGTAVANLHPAVLEASHSSLPLVLVAADRPHELRGTGANQTTAQVGIFAGAVRAALDLPAGFAPAALRGHVARLVAAAGGTVSNDPGPVHLNVGLREPLAPPDSWAPGSLPGPVRVEPAGQAVPLVLSAGRRTVVVAGDGAGPAAAAAAAAGGWPLLAEPTSGSRVTPALTHYQALLTAGLAASAERVLVFGHPTLSRPVSALLARPDLEVVVVGASPRWTDVAGVATAVVGGVSPTAPTTADRAWQVLWQRADAELGVLLDPSPIERAARILWEAAGDTPLVVGSSNAVRALDLAAPAAPVRAVANRGLAGIDGTLATAAGLAAGLGEPVRAVVGDLTFLHDVGSLARGVAEPAADLQVVVLNDAGGGIFAMLEYGGGADRELFLRYFATPQAVDVAPLAKAFGARHTRVGARDLAAALAAPIRGLSVIEVAIDARDLVASRAATARHAAAVVRRVPSQ